MPNWCCTDIHFKGPKENIEKLSNDIQTSVDWMKTNKYRYLNVWQFFLLNGFDVDSYINRYKKYINFEGCNFKFHLKLNFRGSIVNDRIDPIVYHDDGTASIYPYMEMAWGTDYEVIQLISLMYGVEFSAYSEECGMGIYNTCRNGDFNDFDFDVVVMSDAEQVEEIMDEYPDTEIYYYKPFKSNSKDHQNYIKLLEENEIDYSTEKVENINSKDLFLYGVYYDPINGINYDQVKGVTYDDEE